MITTVPYMGELEEQLEVKGKTNINIGNSCITIGVCLQLFADCGALQFA